MKVISLDTENDEHGNLGQWSIAFRNSDGKLCAAASQGVVEKKSLENILSQVDFVAFHNSKWDIRVLARNGMPIPKQGTVVDTMIAAYCMGLGRQDVKDTRRSGDQMVGGLGLKYLSRRHLGMQMSTWEQVRDHPEQMAEYNTNDSIGTYLLWEKWAPVLPEHFWKIDMPLLPVLMKMEDRGIAVDPGFLRQYAENLDVKLKEYKFPFNPYSTPQLRKYIYEDLKVVPWKFTDSGEPSTDSEVLKTIGDPVLDKVVEYKSLALERKTYAGNYLQQISSEGRLHCEFKQTSTATGRLSSANPNLQNVVKSGDLRSLFTAPPGFLLVRVDWKQLEQYVLAAITQDPELMEAYNRGENFHRATLKTLHDALGWDLNDPAKYRDAKSINFLMNYGGDAWKISLEFGVPIDQARAIPEAYFKKYPGVLKFQEQQRAIAREKREIIGHFGRKRRLDAMYSEDWRTRAEGEREAINTPIQNAAAEVVKLAMIDLDVKYHAPMLLQVHDELIFEVPEKEAPEYARWLGEYIPTITTINGVTFPVESSYGKTWKETSK